MTWPIRSLWTWYHSLKNWARLKVCTMCCATRITRTTTRAGWQRRRKPLPPRAAPRPQVRRRCAARCWWLPRLQCPKLKRPPRSSFYSMGASAEACRCSGSSFHFHRCPAVALLFTCRLLKGEALAKHRVLQLWLLFLPHNFKSLLPFTRFTQFF